MAFDINDPETKAAIEQIKTEVAGQFTGLKDKNEELIGEVRKAKETLKQFEGVDIKSIKALQDRMNNDEEFKLLQEGKVDEVFNKRYERVRTEHEGKINELSETIKNTTAERDQYRDRFVRERVSLGLRDAAQKAGVVPEALDDVVLRGSSAFTVEPDGQLVARDQDGKIITDSKGKPITPDSFVDGLRDRAPHYWRQSQGAGYTGAPGTKDSIEAKMLAAADAGDMKEYNRLKAQKNKA